MSLAQKCYVRIAGVVGCYCVVKELLLTLLELSPHANLSATGVLIQKEWLAFSACLLIISCIHGGFS